MDEVVVAVEDGEGGAEEAVLHFDAEDVAPLMIFDATASEALADEEEALIGNDHAIGLRFHELAFLVGDIEEVFVAAENVGDLVIDFGDDVGFLAFVHDVMEGFFHFEDFVEGLPFAEGLVVNEVAPVQLARVEQGEQLLDGKGAVLLVFFGDEDFHERSWGAERGQR